MMVEWEASWEKQAFSVAQSLLRLVNWPCPK